MIIAASSSGRSPAERSRSIRSSRSRRSATRLLVVASAEAAAPYDRLVYRVPIAGGALTRLSADAGMHRASVSPSGSHYIDGHSARTRPRAWDVISVADGAAFRYAEADASADSALGYQPPEAIVTTAADGVTTLHGALLKPVDFDPHRRYAVIDAIYAGPFISVVPWTYVGTSESRIAEGLAQMGFVVMVLDVRGTSGAARRFRTPPTAASARSRSPITSPPSTRPPPRARTRT